MSQFNAIKVSQLGVVNNCSFRHVWAVGEGGVSSEWMGGTGVIVEMSLEIGHSL